MSKMDESFKQRLQDREDQKFVSDAKLEAYDMWLQYDLNKKTGTNFYGIILPKPRRVMIMQYTKSKYNSEDYARIRKEEFIRLKNGGTLFNNL